MTGVGWTATGVAVARALESARPDRLFDDPYAAALAGGDPTGFRDATEQSRAVFAALGDYLALRTVFFDDWLRRAVRTCPQVVVVAAGLDTRPQRLPWPPGTSFYELDQPEVLRHKHSVLGPPSAAVAVEVDLRADWTTPLLAHGFRPEVPTAWLVEGLLVYLTKAENDHLLTTIGTLSAPGSTLGVEHVTEQSLTTDEVRTAATTAGMVRDLSSLWANDSGPESPITWLHTHGWTATAHPLPQLCARHDRPLPPAFATTDATLLTAHRH